jgi:hypothetical protein
MDARLTVPTISYLFASSWAPREGAGWSVRVPGATVSGLETAANLLNLGFWSLQRQGLVELTQLRPVERVSAETMGGPSFARVTRASSADLPPRPGLEGALLDAVRRLDDAERATERLATNIARDDPAGVRGVVLDLGLQESAPWSNVAALCCDEAVSAGLLEVTGRLTPAPVIVDQADIDALRPADREIAEARARYRATESELDAAVIGDCLAALLWAHHTPE